MATFGFIGTGNMGGALARAARKRLSGGEILLANRSAAKAEALAQELDCRAVDNAAVAAEADYIFLGVKPYMVAGLMEKIGPVLAARKDRFVLVSMAAALTIPDLREQYHPGDELPCVVKQFDRKAGILDISVKESVPNPFDEASLRHPLGCRRRATIAGKYAGGVFCNLSDGAVVMCRYSFHYEDSDFKTGDTVMVVIQRYDEGMKQIFGKIVGR